MEAEAETGAETGASSWGDVRGGVRSEDARCTGRARAERPGPDTLLTTGRTGFPAAAPGVEPGTEPGVVLGAGAAPSTGTDRAAPTEGTTGAVSGDCRTDAVGDDARCTGSAPTERPGTNPDDASLTTGRTASRATAPASGTDRTESVSGRRTDAVGNEARCTGDAPTEPVGAAPVAPPPEPPGRRTGALDTGAPPATTGPETAGPIGAGAVDVGPGRRTAAGVVGAEESPAPGAASRCTGGAASEPRESFGTGSAPPVFPAVESATTAEFTRGGATGGPAGVTGLGAAPVGRVPAPGAEPEPVAEPDRGAEPDPTPGGRLPLDGAPPEAMCRCTGNAGAGPATGAAGP